MAGTAAALLDEAEKIVQRQGYNGFSFAHLSAVAGLTKASIHYHFPTKADLGRSLVARYRERFIGALQAITETAGDLRSALQRYADLHEDVLRGERMCLCGILIAEFPTLPAPVQEELLLFTTANEGWLAAQVSTHGHGGVPPRTAAELAKLISAAISGAMFLARATGDISAFRTTAAQVITRAVGQAVDGSRAEPAPPVKAMRRKPKLRAVGSRP